MVQYTYLNSSGFHVQYLCSDLNSCIPSLDSLNKPETHVQHKV